MLKLALWVLFGLFVLICFLVYWMRWEAIFRPDAPATRGATKAHGLATAGFGSRGRSVLQSASRDLSTDTVRLTPTRLRLMCKGALATPGSMLRREGGLSVFRVSETVGPDLVELEFAIDEEGELQWLRRRPVEGS